VADPDQVAVDPATGAIYVLSCSQEYAVIKFAGLGDGKEVCRHPFAPVSKKSPPICQMALDASEKPPVLWLTQNNLASNNSIVQQFLRMTDNGASFSKPEDPRSTEISAQHAHDLTVDRRRNELYIRTLGPVWARLEEKTGKITSPEFKLPGLNRPDLGTPVVVGEDGNIYAWSWLQTFSRFDHEGKPLNFPGSGKHQFELPVPMSFMVRGLYVKSADEMYGVVRNLRLDPGSTTGAGGWWTCLNVIGSDGKSKRTIIWECSQGAIVKLDRKGNIYLADMVKPAGRSYPEFFDGKLPLPPAQAVNPDGTGAQANSWLYGSIMKFPPSGGAIWYGPELKDKEGAPNFVRVGEPPAELLAKPKQKMMAHVGYLTRGTAEVQGALWIHFGYSPLTITSRTGNDTCMCEGSKFEVDDYGRVFFPNLNQFRIEVLDTNGNPITRFGSYGNLDSGGKAGKIVKPEIPLAWPVAVATSETHAYIGDSLNRRVVKVRLACAAEATADIR